jgi:hypothetical protein
MFTDASLLSVTADLRRHDLLVEAEQYRLGRLARAARRAARAAARRAPATPPPRGVPPERTGSGSAADRRTLVPR